MNRNCSLVALSALFLLAAGCKQKNAEAEGETAAAAVPVSVHVLETGTVEDVVRAWATIRPQQEATLLAGVSGRVSAVHVLLGQQVRKGDILLEIEPEVHAAELTEAETNLESAKIALAKAEKDLERAGGMHEAGTLSDSEYEGFKSNEVAARATVARMDAELARARRTVRDSRLAAPFDGRIAIRPPDAGTTVTLGEILTRVVDISTVGVIAGLSGQDLAHVAPGVHARVIVESLPDRVFDGEVVAVGPQADADSRQFPVEIEVKNPPDLPLKAGMVAQVEVVVKTYPDVPLLPVDALVDADGGDGFYVVTGGAAAWRVAELGPRQGQFAALLSGGAPGDSVVVLGQTRLAPGAAVAIEDAP